MISISLLQALVELQVLQYLSEMDPGNESNCIHITVSKEAPHVFSKKSEIQSCV